MFKKVREERRVQGGRGVSHIKQYTLTYKQPGNRRLRKYFTSTAFFEIESQTVVTKANSFTVQINLWVIMQLLAAGGHIHCCLLPSVQLETIIFEAPMKLLSNPYQGLKTSI